MTPMVKSRPFKPPKESTIAYIGLGANLGEREKAIEEALRRIEADDRTSLLRSTVPIETDPVGYEDQPRFLNAAASLATTRSPRELLDLLLEIERDLGRIRGRGPRYGPRSLGGAGLLPQGIDPSPELLPLLAFRFRQTGPSR